MNVDHGRESFSLLVVPWRWFIRLVGVTFPAALKELTSGYVIQFRRQYWNTFPKDFSNLIILLLCFKLIICL